MLGERMLKMLYGLIKLCIVLYSFIISFLLLYGSEIKQHVTNNYLLVYGDE
jgi:hypothetical protein